MAVALLAASGGVPAVAEEAAPSAAMPRSESVPAATPTTGEATTPAAATPAAATPAAATPATERPTIERTPPVVRTAATRKPAARDRLAARRTVRHAIRQPGQRQAAQWHAPAYAGRSYRLAAGEPRYAGCAYSRCGFPLFLGVGF
ncbi:hypothetical protein [Rhodovulum sp. PH10]|uniref:hypothetical protein n=1 Tax=Rhodovulum sp. PH10 TaxID=1187851 RepID=UPI0012FB9821|nr:hypothetical protein [Rhodovulum sp. PH10]